MLGGRELGLLAGGPPCQGFSLAGRREIDDPRNRLVWTFLDVARFTRPRLVLLENVGAIQSPFEKGQRSAVLGELESALRGIAPELGGYRIIRALLRGDHFGVPQRRKRVFLIGVRGDLARYLKIDEWSCWDSESSSLDLNENLWIPSPSEAKSIGAEAALWDIVGKEYLPLSEAPNSVAREFARRMRHGDCVLEPRRRRLAGKEPPNHEFRRHSSRTETRFQLMRIFRDAGIPADLFFRVGNGDLAIEEELRPLEVILPLDLPDRKVSSTRELAIIVRSLGTRKHTQRALDPRQPAPTVTTLPDDMGHYGANRTLSVREMARLQTFPDSFVFCGKVTTGGHSRRGEVPQYSQVGNAVPPRLAYVLGAFLFGLTQRFDNQDG